MPGTLTEEDFYLEEGKYVLTSKYHLKRGTCCGNKCRHCPYIPKYKKGNTVTTGSLDYLLSNQPSKKI